MANPNKTQAPTAARNETRLIRLLDRTHTRLAAGQAPGPGLIITPIVRLMHELRSTLSEPEWRVAVAEKIRGHPVLLRLYEDPFTSYGFRKPRGYPGDAVLMDFIYRDGASSIWVESATPLGRALYRECVEHPSFSAIRARRTYLAQRLAASCREASRPRILAVACGHLREAAVLKALPPEARPERFVAVDRDVQSLALAQSEHADLQIEPLHLSTLDLIRADRQLGTFDFVYCPGLYEYLPDDAARPLTAQLARMLNPGGRLLIANMLPELSSAAYMEAVMDWWLVYRTAPQLESLASSLDPDCRVAIHRHPYIAYLEIEKLGPA
jgi:SAM-dependent methyltransferase